MLINNTFQKAKMLMWNTFQIFKISIACKKEGRAAYGQLSLLAI